jgi:hypothetical protein
MEASFGIKTDVWDAASVREWSDVAAEARKKNVDVHVGRLFGIMVEKAAELPEVGPRRKYKDRVVFQGNQVVTPNWEVAILHNLGSSPSSMEAGTAADCYGCVQEHAIERKPSLINFYLHSSDIYNLYLYSMSTDFERILVNMSASGVLQIKSSMGC